MQEGALEGGYCGVGGGDDWGDELEGFGKGIYVGI